MTVSPRGHATGRGRRGRRGLLAVITVGLLVVAACGDEVVTGSRLSSTTTTATATTATTATTDTTTPDRGTASDPPAWNAPSGRPLRIMALGDSLTDGADPQRPTTSPQSYRGFLEQRLRTAGYDVDFVGTQRRQAIGGTDPDHEGHSGFTIGPDDSTLCTSCGPANIDAGLQAWLEATDPDIVLLLIGVNDLLPARDPAIGLRRETVPEEAADKLRRLVERLRTLDPDRPVVVASYPPVSFLSSPGGGSSVAFRTLNAAAKELGQGSDPLVRYAPMKETFTGSWGEADVLTEVGDTLHPSATGAERIADVWFDALEPLLRAVR
jgi:lysophospholipase L1-like esterase